jgi:predicted secreted protein
MAFIGLGTQFLYDDRYAVSITDVTKADPGVITVSDATNFDNGDLVRIHSVVGMTELNYGIYKLAGKSGSTFELTDTSDADVDTSGYTTYSSGGVLENLSTPNFVALGELNDIQPPSPTKETVDTTHMGSTGGYREFISGLKDGGEVTFQINFIYADYLIFKSNFEHDNNTRKYRVVFPDSPATYWEFDAIVTDIPPNAPTADKVTADITLKVSGQSTFGQV